MEAEVSLCFSRSVQDLVLKSQNKSREENPETCVYIYMESLTLKPAINKAKGSRGSHTGCCSTLLFLCSLGGQEAAQPLSPPRQASTSRGSRRQLTLESAGQTRATQAGRKKCSIVPPVVTKRGQRPWLFTARSIRFFASSFTELLQGGKRPPRAERVREDPSSGGWNRLGKLSRLLSLPRNQKESLDVSCTLHLIWKLNRDVNDSFWWEAQSRNVFFFSFHFAF